MRIKVNACLHYKLYCIHSEFYLASKMKFYFFMPDYETILDKVGKEIHT